MEDKEIQEIWHPPEESWEERTLNLLHESKIDQDFSRAQSGNQRIRKQQHTFKWILRKPMAIPEVILEMQDQASRESAIRCLSNFLLEKREEDPEKYNRTGHMLYFSCSTMAILLQLRFTAEQIRKLKDTGLKEVLEFFRLMTENFVTKRTCKRIINVMTLFQCIAANTKSREKFVESLIPNYLIPVILHQTSFDGFENVRSVALSVFAILCQGREPKVIRWALNNKVVEALHVAQEIGNELSKVICMHIFEAIMRDNSGLFFICSPYNMTLLKKMMSTWYILIHRMSQDIEFSPRLLFHILRCYVLLCFGSSGLTIVRRNVRRHVINGDFIVAAKEFPVIKDLVEQLFLTVGIL